MLGEIRGEVRFKEPLSFHTSLRIGGPADIFVVPQNVDDIRHALLFAERDQLTVTVIGGGNNLIVRDRGVRGVTLKLEGCLGRADYQGEEALAGAGVSLSGLIREAAALSLGGIECLIGIPATVGGALAMNAGTADGWIGDFVSVVYFLYPDGTLGEFKPAAGALGYRAFEAPAGSGADRLPLAAATPSDRRDPSRPQAAPQGEEGDPAARAGRRPGSCGRTRPASWRPSSSRRSACAASGWAAPRSRPRTLTSS